MKCWGQRVTEAMITPPTAYFKQSANTGELYFASKDEIPDSALIEHLETPFGEEDPETGLILAYVQFRQISVGPHVSCGIQYIDGAIRCWGEEYQLHVARAEDVFEGEYRQVSVGELGICAIRQHDRGLSCWGSAATRVGTSVDGIEFDQIKVKDRYVCGVTMNSQLLCWGLTFVDPSELSEFVVA